MELFDSIKDEEKNKIFFIHLNHTNPLLNKDSDQYKFVKSQGYNVAKEGMKLKL
jgi:pyrroloquinoline quinone biosynthesis protein B